jgi:hypothetical protein
MSTSLSGRRREAELIRTANRAAAVGRLMLGEIHDWNEFLQADILELESLPRRALKSGRRDVQGRLRPEIRSFCRKNFIDMSENKLLLLYEEIKAFRGLEMPLAGFERRYSKIQEGVLTGNPEYLTISISLWGLQFKTPEYCFSSDLISAIGLIAESDAALRAFETEGYSRSKTDRDKIRSYVRRVQFATRAAVFTSFNLLEAYLNGIAWRHDRTSDTTGWQLRKKLMDYPTKIAGRSLWPDDDPDIRDFSFIKQFRDAMTHSSPFPAPQKFGGYDRHRVLYTLSDLCVIDSGLALPAVNMVVNLIRRLHKHVAGVETRLPDWFDELESVITDAFARPSP